MSLFDAHSRQRDPFQPVTIAHVNGPPTQIWVEARIVEMDQQATDRLGVSFALHKGGGQFAYAGMPEPTLNPWRIQLTSLSQGLLDLEIQALESEGLSRVLASPTLLVQSGEEALIHQGKEVPYLTQGRRYNRVTFKQAVLSLKVRPIISTDKLWVTLDIDMTKDALSLAYTASKLPMIDTRHLKTKVTVSPGQTVMLGGIVEQSNHSQRYALPGLSQLPLIGRLFQSRVKSKSNKQVMVFITPTIQKLKPLAEGGKHDIDVIEK